MELMQEKFYDILDAMESVQYVYDLDSICNVQI